MQPIDKFDAFFKSGITVGSQVHGTFSVTDGSLEMSDDNGNEIFRLPRDLVDFIHDDLSQIIISSQNQKYVLFFRDAKKGFQRILALGVILGSGGNDGIFGVEPQSRCRQAIESLVKHGYKAELNRHRT